MKLIFSYIVALTMVGFASAQSCSTHRVVSYPTHVVAKPVVVVEKKVVVEVVPIAFYTPVAVALYGGAYIPPVVVPHPVPTPAPPPASTASAGELQQILTAIRQVDTNVRNIEERVRALESRSGGASPPPPAGTPPPGTPRLDPFVPPKKEKVIVPPVGNALSILKNRCASCHGSSASTEGGDFVMYKDDKLVELNDRQWRKVGSKVASGKMPPEKDSKGNLVPTMPDEEASVVAAFLDNLK